TPTPTLPLSLSLTPPHPTSPLFPYTTLFRSTLPITVDVDDMRRVRINWEEASPRDRGQDPPPPPLPDYGDLPDDVIDEEQDDDRSEEHTSELQSRGHLVCRLLLEKKKKNAKD